MEANKLTYDLQKDIDSGAIKVYSPNDINYVFKDYAHLEQTSRLHGYNALEGAKSMMSMYKLNYCRNENDPNRQWCFEAVKKWETYYSVMKSNKKYKCKECGWKGKISEMNDGIWEEYCCPNCDEDFNISK